MTDKLQIEGPFSVSKQVQRLKESLEQEHPAEWSQGMMQWAVAHLISQSNEIKRLQLEVLELEATKAAVEMAQDYINNILGCPSPDFLASSKASKEVENA